MSTPNEPSAEDLRGAPVLPGFEAPEEVILKRGIVHSDGLQPEDLGVLAWLKLRDPRLPATQEDLAKEMQAHGWKMGKSRFAGVFQRLKSAGHIKHQSAYNPDTGRPEWHIEFFMNPANNDHYVNSGISAFPQVTAETLEIRDSQKEQLFETPETSVSRGQKESQVSRDSEGNPGNRGFPPSTVPAGHSRNSENPGFGAAPPHPPVGGGNTTPSPQKTGRASKWQEACALHPDDYVPTAEEIKAAAEFLQGLPGKWQHSVDEARDVAPLLASRAHMAGVELDLMLELQLMAEDPSNPARSGVRVMPTRVRKIKKHVPEEQKAEQGSGLADWCGECNRGEYPAMPYQRLVELDDGREVFCPKCHPKHARAARN